MTIYMVSNDHQFARYYFESKEDAENFAGQFSCAVGMQVFEIYVLESSTKK